MGASHYPIVKSDLLGCNCSFTSHFNSCILWDKLSCSQSRYAKVNIQQYMSYGLYQPVPSLGIVLAGSSPRACTVEYTLLSICSENVQNTWSWLIQPFAKKPWQELLSGCIRLRPMWRRAILSPFRTITSQFAITNWSGEHFLSFSFSAQCIL